MPRVGDTGLDHNIPNLDKQMKNMSLHSRPPPPKESSPGFGELANWSRNGTIQWRKGGKKSKKMSMNKKRKFSKSVQMKKRRYTKRNTKK